MTAISTKKIIGGYFVVLKDPKTAQEKPEHAMWTHIGLFWLGFWQF
jgi:hypothetical protein